MNGELSAPSGATPSNLRDGVANPRQLLATRLARLALEKIAKAIGKDDTEACKVRSGERRCSVSEFCALIDLSDLKLVDKSRVCVDRQAYDSMVYIAQKAMADQSMARKLIWEDDQG